MDILKNAKDLQEELVAHRRYLHEHAEIGFALKNTTAYVCEKLEEMGYEPRVLGKSGVVATVGKGKRSFLLRADMDALPIKEETGETFACEWGNMHACGHDLHTAMLLGAAKLLKMHEGSLKGQIRLFFQTAEEILEGAKTGLKEGVLRPLKPNAGIMLTQDIGSKAYCIGEMLRFGYSKQKTLMVGDAMGDLEAARKNGVYYFPILPGKERESWQELVSEGLARLAHGSFGGEYQEKKIKEFMENFK